MQLNTRLYFMFAIMGLLGLMTGCPSPEQEPPPAPEGSCAAAADGQCVADCPTGLVCNDTCDACVFPTQNPCSVSDGVCSGECPDGMSCRADCTGCELDDDPPCETGIRLGGQCVELSDPCNDQSGECVDTCPAGFSCDPTCTGCLPEGGGEPCVLAGDMCRDTCPDGSVCGRDCTGCIPAMPQPDCQPTPGSRTCEDNCPEGQTCDARCLGCVDEMRPCALSGRQCVDSCPDGQSCDARCEMCVDPPAPCQMNGRECMDACPEGQVCDPSCRGCVPVDADVGVCGAPTVIRGLPADFRTDIGAAANGHQGRCAGNGPEEVFGIAIPVEIGLMTGSTQICVDTTGSDIDTVLHVRAQDCENPGNEVACVDDVNGSQQAKLEFVARHGLAYFVFLDSFNMGGSAQIRFFAGPCDPAMGQCQREAGVCMGDCPDGFRCNAACDACEADPDATGCGIENRVCINGCTNGRSCNADCTSCSDDANDQRTCQQLESIVDGCPNPSSPNVEYNCRGVDCCANAGVWQCPEGSRLFNNECGCGCVNPDRACEDNCPRGQTCSRDCAMCIDGR